MVLFVQWNFPAFLAIAKIGPVVAAGCTLILKPAEQTPLTALYVASLIKEVNFELSSLELCVDSHSLVKKVNYS